MNVHRSLTGNWKLNLGKSTSQYGLLGAMGRKFWEKSCIDKANEDFCLFHFQKSVNDKIVHYFEKFVVIYLDSSVLKLLSALLPIEFDKVRYTHKLVANNQVKAFPDDEKRFGACTARTTWEHDDNREGFMIRWYLKNMILKAFHFVNDKGELQMEMELTDHLGKVTKAIKIYDRTPFTADQSEKLNQMTYKTDLV